MLNSSYPSQKNTEKMRNAPTWGARVHCGKDMGVSRRVILSRSNMASKSLFYRKKGCRLIWMYKISRQATNEWKMREDKRNKQKISGWAKTSAKESKNLYIQSKQGRIHKAISRLRLGRGGNVVGRGGGECHIHDSISSMQLGRGGDARNTRKTVKK